MCTLTVLSRATGYLVGINRDENRSRVLATKLKTVVSRAGFEIVYPLDPPGGGTWIGANSRGLTAVLLNQHPPDFLANGRPYVSRGTIIPSLLECSSATESLLAAESLRPGDYPPFLLALIDPSGGILRLASDSKSFTRLPAATAPFLASSSSHDDAGAYRLREKEFEDFRSTCHTPTPAQLFEFFSRQKKGFEALSVCMERAEARTVSFTGVEAGEGKLRFFYCPSAPHRVEFGQGFLEARWPLAPAMEDPWDARQK